PTVGDSARAHRGSHSRHCGVPSLGARGRVDRRVGINQTVGQKTARFLSRALQSDCYLERYDMRSVLAGRSSRQAKQKSPDDWRRQGILLSRKSYYFATTFEALGPLGESTNSNSTVWPSSRFLNPPPVML